MACTSDAFKPINASQTLFQRSVKTSEEEAWQTPMTWITTIRQDLSKRDIHINLRDISAIEKLESMCHDRVGWKARCSMREPRETSPLSSVSAQHVASDCSDDDDCCSENKGKPKKEMTGQHQR